MIDHVGYAVTNYKASLEFYKSALAPLDYKLVMEVPAAVTGTFDAAGFGTGARSDFWISGGAKQPSSIHLCFRAASKEQVDAFYVAALEAGGKDNGKPGIRPHYDKNYYAAFVYDLDGHNVEAVYRGEGFVDYEKP